MGIDDDKLLDASALLKEEMKAQGLLTSTISADGTEWLDTLDATLDLAASVATDPGVQRTIMEKSRDQALVLRLMREQPSPLTSPSPLAMSYEHVRDNARREEEVMSVASSSPLPGSSPSLSEILAAENDALRSENATLRAALRSDQPCPRPAVARVQAAARGRLTRLGFYDDDETAKRLAPTPPSVHVTLSPAVGGGVRLTLNVRPAVAMRPPAVAARARAAPRAARRVPAGGPLNKASRDRMVLTMSVVVGLLALLIARNPLGARAAAAGAAGTVAALYARANQRGMTSATVA